MKQIIKRYGVVLTALLMVVVIGGFSSVFSQTTDGVLAPATKTLVDLTVGLTKDEVIEKIGKPKFSDKTSMGYSFSKTKTAQLGFDKAGKLRTIAVIYTDGDESSPTFADIFGPDVPLVEDAKGGVYKLIRYPGAGFYVAYSRNSAKKPMVIVTMRRIATK